ncbi:tetratricopeptide repeat protein [Pseudocolwellia agarivorans]|uniref:tetratricopeptide repeat protein n=1 Tax=Pseudocolwellia agarivorans TaxID=1911682 RepID=UPI000B5AFDF6|nr:tetratricopeptide repeat protein [Pseudocolwellia agarivorans]
MIKKLSLSLISAAVLFSTASFIPNELGGAVAQAEEKAQSTETVKVPAMRNRVYSQLARAQKLADEGNKKEGLEVLDEVKDRISSLNSYEQAMLWNFYGFMYYGSDNLPLAIESFEKVIAEEAIPLTLRTSTLYSLAQLSMQQQDYNQSLKYLGQWKKINAKPLTSTQQVLFAQIYYQNKDYKNSLKYVNEAVELSLSKDEVPKENWFILQRANYYELKQPENVVKVIEDLVRFHDKPKYWIQLSGMYGEIGEEEKQLAVMESAYQAGYVTSSQDIITLVQLYRFHGVPYKAAKLLSTAIDKGQVAAEEKYLDMLAQSYISAKNDEKAIPVLVKASEIAETGKFDAFLAQSYLNLEKWDLAIASAKKAIKRGGVDRLGNMHLVIGMSNFNLKKFDASLTAFADAQKLKESAKTAEQWYQYVKREQSAQMQLAMLNE